MFFKGLFLLLLIHSQSWAQSFEVSPSLVTAFAENTITVHIEGLDCDQMQVRTDNGKIKRNGNCRYLLIPQRLGAVNISVSKVVNGEVFDLGQRTLSAGGKNIGFNRNANTSTTYQTRVVKKVQPEFGALFAAKDTGDIRKRIFAKSKTLELYCDDAKAFSDAKIVSFKVFVINQDNIEYSNSLEGNALDLETITRIVKCSEGSKVLFSSICILYKEKIIKLKDISFVLRN